MNSRVTEKSLEALCRAFAAPVGRGVAVNLDREAHRWLALHPSTGEANNPFLDPNQGSDFVNALAQLR